MTHSNSSFENLPFHSHSSRENATPSSGTSPIAYYTEVPFPGYQHLISYVLTSSRRPTMYQ